MRAATCTPWRMAAHGFRAGGVTQPPDPMARDGGEGWPAWPAGSGAEGGWQKGQRGLRGQVQEVGGQWDHGVGLSCVAGGRSPAVCGPRQQQGAVDFQFGGQFGGQGGRREAVFFKCVRVTRDVM